MSRSYFDHVANPRQSKRISSEQPREERPLAELVDIARAYLGIREHVTMYTGADGRLVIESMIE